MFKGSAKKLKPYLFRPALYYYCCHQGARMSFVELFNDLARYVKDPRKR